MEGNKLINYTCFALAYCDQKPMDLVKSVGLSISKNISSVYAQQKNSPVATFGLPPDIEFNYTSHAVFGAGFPGFPNEAGLNGFIGFDVLIGPEEDTYKNYPNSFLQNPISSVRLTNMLLTSVTYNLPIDGFFSIERTFKGLTKKFDCGALGRDQASSGIVMTQRMYSEDNSILPPVLNGTSIQNIKTTMTINRTLVNEFATRKPYASYVNFPIQTQCTIETVLNNNLDNFDFNHLDTACKNDRLYSQDITIATCGGPSIYIPKANFTSLSYSGGEADSNSSNLRLSLTYTSYEDPVGVAPVIYIDESKISDPCAC